MSSNFCFHNLCSEFLAKILQFSQYPNKFLLQKIWQFNLDFKGKQYNNIVWKQTLILFNQLQTADTFIKKFFFIVSDVIMIDVYLCSQHKRRHG